jgi:hypothetical protein
MSNTNALVPLGDMERMASAIAKSGLFGLKTPEQALALFLVSQSEGRHPASAAKEYHIINGRPALRADAILARFQAAGGSVAWGDRNDTKVSGTFSHPQGGSLTVTWSIEDAKRAGIFQNQWLKYPRQMLTARCISEGVRAVFPAVTSGVYTPEEVQDFDPPGRSQPSSPSPFRAVRSQEKVIEEAVEVVATKAEPSPALPAPVKVDVTCDESPNTDLEKLFKLMDRDGVPEAAVLGFVNRKGANKGGAEYVADLPKGVIKRLVSKWEEIVVGAGKGAA